MSKKVIILGAGVGGVAAALEVAKNGFEAVIIEEKEEILSGTSNATPGRAGHGFHYANSDTGKLYLESTIKVLREYPGCTLGTGKPDHHFMRHGLYVVMKGDGELSSDKKEFKSLYPAEQIMKTYEELREHYKSLVERDPKNKLFGDPEHFFVERGKEEYDEIIDVSNVSKVVDTREELLDWPKLRKMLISKVKNNPNIRIISSTRVKEIQYGVKAGYNIITENGHFEADYIVNSTWHDMDRISRSLGLYSTVEDRTLRLKGLVKVKLPEELVDKKSMFFCIGPHCMFSNMGNGTGMMTYAPVTNISQSKGVEISEEEKRFLSGSSSHEERVDFATRVIKGVSKYVPAMEKADVIDVNFGIIKTKGGVDVFSPSSDFHRRDYLGVDEVSVGIINNSAMKLLHFHMNGKVVYEMLSEQVKAKKAIQGFLLNGYIDPKVKGNRDILRMLSVVLERGFSSKELLDSGVNIYKCLIDHVKKQNYLTKEIRRHFGARRYRFGRKAVLVFSAMAIIGLGLFLHNKSRRSRFPGISAARGPLSAKKITESTGSVGNYVL